MNSVFKYNLEDCMQQELVKLAFPNAPNLKQAAENLHAALEIFENAGLQKQADNILKLMQKIANDNNEAATKKQDWHTKNLSPKRQVENIKDHGTQFNMADDNVEVDEETFEDE